MKHIIRVLLSLGGFHLSYLATILYGIWNTLDQSQQKSLRLVTIGNAVPNAQA